MGKAPAPGHKKRKKLILSFDEDARKEYLGGFRKRRQQRKDQAQTEIEKKLKNKIRQERNKRRKANQEKINGILKGIRMPDDDDDVNNTAEGHCEKIDFGTHEVLIKSDIDFADSGLVVARSKMDTQENNIGSDEQNPQMKELKKAGQSVEKYKKYGGKKKKRR